MGGALLKEYTRRHSASEYFQKTEELVKEIAWADSDLKFLNMEVIKAYRNKESFGDADIVYSTYDDKPFSVAELDKEFSPQKIVKNGEVISFDYKNLQVDMIHAEKSYFDYAKQYFSWNDFGNFSGKLARYFGLSHGHKGLYLPIRDNNDNLVESVLVSLDHDKFLEFVGLDVETFRAGFDTMEDVYRYVQSSPYFSTDSYKLENISAIGRVRDRKRESYRNFLKFNESYTGTNAEKVADKTIFLPLIFKSFPGTEERFAAAMKNMLFKRELRNKFNGDIVSLLTGLNDKTLGQFMSHLRKLPSFIPSILIYLSQKTITNMIVSEFENYKNV